MNNRRGLKILLVAGLQLTEAEWADLRGIDPSVIRKRLRMGWSVPDAVLSPVRPKRT